MSYKILSYPGNARVYKSIIAGKYNGVEVEYPAFQFGVDNKTPEFLANVNPNGKVPALVGPEGAIFESNAILRYISRLGCGAAYGKSIYESAQVDQWIDWTAGEIESNMYPIIGPIYGFMPYNKKNEQESLAKIQKSLEVLNGVLANKTFLVGNKVTSADIAVFCGFFYLFADFFDAKLRAPYKYVMRWFNTIAHQANVVAVIGEYKLCEVQKKPQLPKKAEKPKEEAKPEPKKEEKQEEAEEEEETVVEVPQGFQLDDFKRNYSNNDVSVSIPYFFEKFDKETHSIYFCDYKYNNENDSTFRTRNLVGGWFQRLEKLRKIGFGSVLLVGEEKQHDITGCWVFKGQDVPAEMTECDDYVLYNWRKGDAESDKQLVSDFFAWEKPINGKAFLDGKIFK